MENCWADYELQGKFWTFTNIKKELKNIVSLWLWPPRHGRLS